MCGIAGIVSFNAGPVLVEDVSAMCAAMVHRGPDDEGFHVGPRVGLGMRRLSIIDLATGHQPIANEDGTVWAILNGEIYNYRELRHSLECRGHVFRTATDTETIVHLYEEYGERCVEKLRGMFAFAVWDERRRALLLARDRLGIKPLYYTLSGGRLLFASELKALLQLPEVERTVNPGSLDHLLTFLYTPPSESIVAGVRKLGPGRVLVASAAGEIRTERYWTLRFEPARGLRVVQFEDRLRELLRESVDLHMVSDVPLGAFLSGGIDSSSVVATMARLSPRPVKTFSIGFPDRDFTELDYARQVASALGTDHHELIVEPGDLHVVEEIAWHLDEPFGDSSSIPTWFVSKLAAQEVTVALSGDGGDELFGGYDKYVVEGRACRPEPPLALVAAEPRSRELSASRHPGQGRSHEHGALAGGARSLARPQAGGVRRDHSAGAPLAPGHHQVRLQAGDEGHPARRGDRAAQARFRHPARALVPGQARRFRARPAPVGHLPPARVLQSALPRRVACAATPGRSRAAALDASLLRALVPGVPRPAPQRQARGARTRHMGLLRIAIVAPSLDILGGQGVQAKTLAEQLAAEGYDVDFIPVNPGFPAGLRWLRRLRYLRTALNQALYLASLRRLRRCGVVHVFAASYWSFLLAAAPAIAARCARGCCPRAISSRTTAFRPPSRRSPC